MIRSLNILWLHILSNIKYILYNTYLYILLCLYMYVREGTGNKMETKNIKTKDGRTGAIIIDGIKVMECTYADIGENN